MDPFIFLLKIDRHGSRRSFELLNFWFSRLSFTTHEIEMWARAKYTALLLLQLKKNVFVITAEFNTTSIIAHITVIRMIASSSL